MGLPHHHEDLHPGGHFLSRQQLLVTPESHGLGKPGDFSGKTTSSCLQSSQLSPGRSHHGGRSVRIGENGQTLCTADKSVKSLGTAGSSYPQSWWILSRSWKLPRNHHLQPRNHHWPSLIVRLVDWQWLVITSPLLNRGGTIISCCFSLVKPSSTATQEP